MEVLITGGAGFLGSKLARQLLARGTLAGPTGQPEKISRITLLDQVAAQGFDDPRIAVITGDAADPAVIAKALTPSIQSVFHLAAVVSGEAESDFDLGMRINLDATRILLEQARKNGNRPRVVFTSSVAVFGGDLPPKVLDTTPATPQGSYGAQKAMCELMVTDYSRKGFVDGRSLRLPTVTVRPGKANKAASSFASGIIREPLNGVVSVCPVPPETKVWALSPRSTVHNVIHAHELESAAFGTAGAVNLPGLTTTVGEMVAAMGRVAGAETMKRVEWKEDPVIMKLVRTWPGDFVTTRAEKMGFVHDANFDEVVKAYIEEELR
ncbi:MAG: SDR family oxidoreductase [Betaproteobacteria bacterium]|nr:SDR family oxidoreductase [Betaproteobacteria bacterium]